MCNGQFCNCAEHSEFMESRRAGHPVVDWPGWQNNDARYSVQPDINPIPISPVHFTDWTGRQIQLSNGWALTNWGKRDPYDHYLRLLQSSNSGTSKAHPLVFRGNAQQPTGSPGPSTKQLQNQISNNAPSGNIGPGAGKLAPGLSLTGRRYYG